MNRQLPELTDERIDAMRDNMLVAIDAHAARRTRRHRLVGAVGVLAVAALIMTPVVVEQVGAGNVSSAEMTTQSSAGDSSAHGEAFDGDESPANGKGSRDVVTTGEVSVAVGDPRAAAGRLSDWALDTGGHVDDRQERSSDGSYATLTVRVPRDSLTEALDELRSYGDVEDVSISRQDVTDTRRDLEARIGALQVSIDRLQAIMADAKSSDDLLEAETALTQRQEQLESLESQQAALGDQVELSTLHVSFTEAAKAGTMSSGGFTGGLLAGWNALVAAVDGVVTAVGVTLPWLALLALVGGLVVTVRAIVRGRPSR